jgi:hypothetical protein
MATGTYSCGLDELIHTGELLGRNTYDREIDSIQSNV